jgi:hypothetical protein
VNLDCIAEVLIEANLATALGVDIFEHHIPETCTQGILLKLPMDGIPVNHYIIGFYKGSFQAILRSKDHAFGDAQSLLINNALTFYNRTFTDPVSGDVLMRVLQCFPLTRPVVYPRTQGNEYEWACNIKAHYIMI